MLGVHTLPSEATISKQYSLYLMAMGNSELLAHNLQRRRFATSAWPLHCLGHLIPVAITLGLRRHHLTTRP
jgi:hypothetical protein